MLPVCTPAAFMDCVTTLVPFSELDYNMVWYVHHYTVHAIQE